MAASWGSTFYLIHDLLRRVPAIDFLALRFSMGAVFLVILAPRAIGRLSASARKRAVVLGLLYGFGQILQTIGLASTPASVSGFITGMYVVLTPVFAALILRSRITGLTWVAVLLAISGIAVMTLTGFSIGYGQTLTLVASALYALHIVGLGAWSVPSEAIGVTTVQIITIAVVCAAVAAPGGIVIPHTSADWTSVIYMGLIPGALAVMGQTWAQAHLSPTRAAIIMSMEPVFAAFFATLFGGESMTLRVLLGGAMVLSAMLIVELMPRRRIEAEVTHIAV
jgi:drug/metabolite transporter (DMT)-like permease